MSVAGKLHYRITMRRWARPIILSANFAFLSLGLKPWVPMWAFKGEVVTHATE